MLDDSIRKLFQAAIAQADDDELRRELELAQSIELPAELLADDDEEDEEKVALAIRELSVPARMKLALLGNHTARGVLIRDANRQVQMFVLQNPRLSENEVNDFARNTNLDETVLREISRNGTWMKNYGIKLNLVSNPKTPIDVSIGWVKFLREKDLKILGKSKNIPQVVSIQCRKLSEKRTD